MAIEDFLGIGVGLINSGLSYWSNQQTNAMNRQLYEDAKKHSIDMMNIQNQYNDPSQQMMRFARAGLNPHLVYGKGAQTLSAVPTSPSPPQMQPPFSQPFDISYIYQLKQNKLLNEQIKAQKLSNESAFLDNEIKKYDLRRKDRDSRLDDVTFDFDYDMKMHSKNKLKWETETAYNNYLQSTSERLIWERLNNEDIPYREAKSRFVQLEEQIKTIIQNRSMSDYQLQLLKQGIGPSDNALTRWLGRVLMELDFNPATIAKYLSTFKIKLF